MVSAKCGLYSVEFVLAWNFHSKANPVIDAAASYFTKLSASNCLASYVAIARRSRIYAALLLVLVHVRVGLSSFSS